MGSPGLIVTTPRGSVGGAAKTMEAAKNVNNATTKNNERFIQKPPSLMLFALNAVPAFITGRALSLFKNQKAGKDMYRSVFHTPVITT